MITLQQTITGGSNSSGATLGLTWGGNTSTGNLIVVAVSAQLGTVTSITDSQTNTYTSINAQVGWSVGSNNFYLYYAKGITGGTTPTITINIGGSTGFAINAVAREYSGIDRDNALDKNTQTTDTSGSSSALSSGATAAITFPQELVIGVGTNASGFTYTAGAGYGNIVNATTATTFTVGMEDKIVLTNATQTAAMTQSSTGNWACKVATFRAVRPSFQPNQLRPAIFKPGSAR